MKNVKRGPGSVASITRSVQCSGGFHGMLGGKGHMFGGRAYVCVCVGMQRGRPGPWKETGPLPGGQAIGSSTRCGWGKCHSGTQSIGQEITFPCE